MLMSPVALGNSDISDTDLFIKKLDDREHFNL